MAQNTIELVTKYEKAVDEMFSSESKRDLVTNQDYKWDGSQAIKIYKISTAEMNDYNRSNSLNIQSGEWSRYGNVKSLDATTEFLSLSKDRSFTFMIDKMDVDETGESLEAATALARQEREVVIPEYDKYIYSKLVNGAGTTAIADDLNESNIYDKILEASAILDDFMVPETERVIIIPPKYYRYLKKSAEIAMSTEVGQEMRLKGVVGVIDGIQVVKVPSSRLPENTGFIICHPSACVAPIKLQEFKIHENPPGLSGYLIEGRMYYDAFILDNKKNAIYVQPVN